MDKIDKESVISFDFEPQAVVLGGGNYPKHIVPLRLLTESERLVCCDGSANQFLKMEKHPWRIVGDGDSLSEEARVAFKEIIRVNPDQETNDQTKAVHYLQNKGYSRIAIVGATGEREDHTLGNISLLIEYMRQGLEVRMFTDYGMFVSCFGDQKFSFPVGTAVSVFGFGTKKMSSEGLAYPLYDFNNWWQGTLNHSTFETFTISCQGEYLVYVSYENKKVK